MSLAKLLNESANLTQFYNMQSFFLNFM